MDWLSVHGLVCATAIALQWVVGGEKMGDGVGVSASRPSLSLGSWVAAAVSRSFHLSFRRHRRCRCALRWPRAVAHAHSTPPAPLPTVAPYRARVHIVVCPCWWSRLLTPAAPVPAAPCAELLLCAAFPRLLHTSLLVPHVASSPRAQPHVLARRVPHQSSRCGHHTVSAGVAAACFALAPALLSLAAAAHRPALFPLLHAVWARAHASRLTLRIASCRRPPRARQLPPCCGLSQCLAGGRTPRLARALLIHARPRPQGRQVLRTCIKDEPHTIH